MSAATMKIIEIRSDVIERFKDSWPAHGICGNVDFIVAAFDEHGDLIDYQCEDKHERRVLAGRDSGDALAALFSDAFVSHSETAISGAIAPTRIAN